MILARLAIGLVFWGAALFATLQIQYASGDWGHVICGPWGCGPTMQVLVACHSSWLVLAVPLVALSVRFWSGRVLRSVGKVLVLVGLAGLIGIGVWQAATWLPEVPLWQRDYFIQRWLFKIGTLVEAPLVPLLFAGIALWVAGLSGRKSLPAMEQV